LRVGTLLVAGRSLSSFRSASGVKTELAPLDEVFDRDELVSERNNARWLQVGVFHSNQTILSFLFHSKTIHNSFLFLFLVEIKSSFFFFFFCFIF